MASTYSPLKIELITTGEQSATWGVTTNVNLGTAIEEAITGSADVTFASANVTLTLSNTNGTQTARNLRLRLTGTTAGARNLIVPAIEKQYIVQNDTADTITIKNSTGTGVAIPTTMTAIVYNDGTNVSSASIYSTSVVTPLLAATDASFVNALPVTSGGTGVTTATGTGSVVRATSPTLTTPALGTPTSGTLTSCTGLPLSTGVTGTLGVSNGGTGVTTSTGSGANALATSPTLVTPILGTPTSGTLTNCTGLPMTTGVTGTLGVLNGGTGVTTSTGSGANVLSTSPTLVTPVLGTPTSGTLTSCTGLPLSTGVTGTLGVSNGGTGVTTSTGSGANALATSPTLVTPILGTPTSGTLTNCTGLPVSTGISGLAVGTATFLATPSSANLAAMLTDETGTGANVFATSPTLVTPALGTPSAAVLTNATGLPLSTGVTGTLGVSNGGTGVTTSTGSGANVLATSPTLVTPILGTPTSGTLTSCTGLPLSTGITGTLGVSNGGTGVTTSTGSGANVLATSPTLVTPNLGTPSALVGTNITGTAAGLSIGGNAATATTATTATNATNATQITNSGGWNITPSGTTLYFNYNGTNVGSLTSTGDLTVIGNVIANGTV